jgi:hypothetical protein
VRKLCNKIRVFCLDRKLIEYKEQRKLVHGARITGGRCGIWFETLWKDPH